MSHNFDAWSAWIQENWRCPDCDVAPDSHGLCPGCGLYLPGAEPDDDE